MITVGEKKVQEIGLYIDGRYSPIGSARRWPSMTRDLPIADLRLTRPSFL